MTKSRILAAAYVLVSVCVSGFLWHYWTPRCNELCPEWLVLSMYATVLGIPPLAVIASAVILNGKASNKLSGALFGLGVVAVVLWASFLTLHQGY